MHYFTINSEDNRHLGFLVLMVDDENDSAATGGCFAVKAQAEMADQQACPALWRVLQNLSAINPLYWQQHGDSVRLLDDNGEPIGHLQQQHLKLNGQHFVLQDLSGTL